jgi:FkbM family methyltransferase
MNRKKIAAIKALLGSCPHDSLTLLDVGASGGIQRRWLVIEEFLRVIGVEPDPAAHAELVRQNKDNDTYLDVALSKQIETRVLYIANKQECSSLYQPNSTLLGRFHEFERFGIKATTSIACSTLDAEFERRKLGRVDFIKLDVQGSEYDIVQGGQKVLATAFGVETEAEFQPLYKGQPLFADIDRQLRAQGFELFDLARHFWRRTIGGTRGSYRGQLIWGDALYLRSVNSFKAGVTSAQSTEERHAMLMHAISICLLYGYPDYAREVVGALQSEYAKEVIAFVNKQIDNYLSSSFWLPQMRGQARLSGILQQLLKFFSQNAFNADDPGLGN